MIVSYLGHEFPSYAFDSGDSAWEKLRCAEGDTMTVTRAKAGNMACLGLGMPYRDAEFYTPLTAGLREMMNHEGPCYIHCLEGKDRTGLVCILLKALAGADGEEIAADYMETYRNYYGITPGTEKYDAVLNVQFYDMYDWLCGLGGGTPEEGAKAYLSPGGMTGEETERLISFLTD